MSTISERTNRPQVLLVEDNTGDAILMKRAFGRADVPPSLTVASTAEIALKRLRHEGEYDTTALPDLILLDLNLPKMRGHAFLAQVKADPILRPIPVVILSSSSAVDDLAQAYNDFANGFVIKPIRLEDYDNIVSIIEDYWFGLMQTLPHADIAIPPIKQTQAR